MTINWIAIIFSFLVSVASLYRLLADPIRYGMKRFILLTVIGCISMIGAIIFYWNASLPKVGPIGNAPNESLNWAVFLIFMTLGGCCAVAGAYGVGKHISSEQRDDEDASN